MSDVIFEVTKENLETGLRGYPVGYCVTSSVDPMKGLSYMGKEVTSFVNSEPEEVIYLLYHGREGSSDSIKQFTDELAKRSVCSKELLGHIKALPRHGHPMKLFCAAILLCGMMESTGDYRNDCLNIIAKIPQITATVINHHAGWAGTPVSMPHLGYIENFAQMLNVPLTSSLLELTKVLKIFNILHYDHGGGNLSAFVGKAVASGLEDMYGSLAAALCALAGPRHGKANQDSLQFVKDIYAELESNLDKDTLAKLIEQRLEKKELIFGFGHAVLRVEDPRATLFYNIAKEKYSDHPLVQTALLLREVVPGILKKKDKISDPFPNVDAISGTLLTAAGFPYPEYFTVLFGMSRVVGIAIQIVYERCEARGGKGTPIVRPKYLYKGRET